MAKLIYKLHITGILKVETGMHIGGSEAELDIGGIDSSVIKAKRDGERIPYIPGSSLKGKLRNLIARSKGYTTKDDDREETESLFEGNLAVFNGKNKRSERFENYKAERKRDRRDKLVKSSIPSRLIFRDAYMLNEKYKDFLEDKAENVITRESGGANPRHLERVTEGAEFGVDIIMDVYKRKKDESKRGSEIAWEEDNATDLLNTLRLGFQLLQMDYLGGSGTRGYGQVSLNMNPVKEIQFDKHGNVNIESYKDKDGNPYEFDFEGTKSTTTA